MFHEIKTKKYYLRYSAEYSALAGVFSDLDSLISASAVKTYKKNPGDGTAVHKIDVDGKLFIVKRYNANTLKLAVKRLLFGNKAKTSWNSAVLLNKSNIPSVKPVALVQHYRFGLRSHAFFVSEYVDGVTAREYFQVDSEYKPHWPQAIEAIQSMTMRLKERCFVHDDYQCANILMVNHQPVLIDLDHLRQYPHQSEAYLKEHAYDVEHFHRLLAYNPEVQSLFQRAHPTSSVV